MHSNIYSRDEMLHHRSSFDLYATALKPCGSSAILAPRARDQVIKQLLVLQPQRAGLWLEALAVRDALYGQFRSDAAPCENSAGRPAVQNRSACARIAGTASATCRHRSHDRNYSHAIRNSSV